MKTEKRESHLDALPLNPMKHQVNWECV